MDSDQEEDSQVWRSGHAYWPHNDAKDPIYQPVRSWPGWVLFIGWVLFLLFVAGGCAPAQPDPAGDASYRHVREELATLEARVQCLETLPADMTVGRALHECNIGGRE